MHNKHRGYKKVVKINKIIVFNKFFYYFCSQSLDFLIKNGLI